MYKNKFLMEENLDLNCKIYYIPHQKIKKMTMGRIQSIYNSPRKSALIYLLTYRIRDEACKKMIIDYLHNFNVNDDKKIYKEIRKIMEINGVKISDDEKRGEYRLNTISKYISVWSKLKPTCYLDVGCFMGDITRTIGKYFDLDPQNIHGIDLKNHNAEQNEKFVFKLYDGMNIPYDNEYFDLITCFMVLHHVQHNNLDTLLSEIFRIMKPGGTLLLREHNAEKKDYDLLDVLHEYYDYVLNSNETWAESKGYYNTCEYWCNKIILAGFEPTTKPFLRRNNPKNPFNNYMASFMKPLGIYN